MKPSGRKSKIEHLRAELARQTTELAELIKACPHVTDEWESAIEPTRPDRLVSSHACSICGTTVSVQK